MSRRSMRRVAELAKAPEDEVAALSCLAKYRKGRRITRDGHLPSDKEQTFVWRLLNGSEEDQAVANAVQRLNDMGVPVELRAYSDLEDSLTWEILALAMRDPDDSERPFADNSFELRDILTGAERDILHAYYADFKDSVDPDPFDLSPEMFLAIDNAVKKKDGANLSAFGSCALASYLLTMDNPPSI